MKRLVLILLLLLTAVVHSTAQPTASPPRALEQSYGENNAVGGFVAVNDTKLYYESYGSGPPLLMLHANGGNIATFAAQIQFFSTRYRVIAVDHRDHGKSESGSGRLTYEKMAADVNALIDHLELPEVHVLGWSDGGIVGLLLAIRHPSKVAKLAIMGANLEPSGAYDWAVRWARREIAVVERRLAEGDKTRDWAKQRRHLDLLVTQPNIPVAELAKITAPTLVLAGDKDVIRPEHTLKIFQALPKAHLAILPGSTHFAPTENPTLFNQLVDDFFLRPFHRPETSDVIR